MRIKLLTFLCTCSLAAVPAALAAPPTERGNSPAVVFTEHEQGTFVAADRTNPCSGTDDLTIVFEGRSFVHVVEKVVDGAVEEARVLAFESGTFTAAIAGVSYTGRASFSSRVIMNRHTSNFAVQEWLRATSASGETLRFHVQRLLVFNAANPSEPVVSTTRVRAVGCPAAASSPSTGAAPPAGVPAKPAAERSQGGIRTRIVPRRRHA